MSGSIDGDLILKINIGGQDAWSNDVLVLYLADITNNYVVITTDVETTKVNWGDGSISEGTVSPTDATLRRFEHTYNFGASQNIACVIYGCKYFEGISVAPRPVGFFIGQSLLGIRRESLIGFRMNNLIIPNNVTLIGMGALHGCSFLESLTLPFVGTVAGVSSESNYQYPIGYIFGESSYTGGQQTIQNYYISPHDTRSDSYYIPSSLTNVTVTGGHILYGAFWGCVNFSSINIGSGVLSVSPYAFCGCAGLQNINVSNNNQTYKSVNGNLYSKNGQTFILCPANKTGEISISNSVINIGDIAFQNCINITSITIPVGVTNIGSSAFSGCESLINIIVPDSVITVGANAFANCPIQNAIIPALVAPYIKNDELESVEITSGDALENSAFLSCASLMSVTLPDTLTSIGTNAFRGCTALTNISLPDNIIRIGDGAFAYCSGLSGIIMGDNIEELGVGAFVNCTGFNSITIRATTPPTLANEYVFNNTNNCPIYVPSSSVNAYKTATYWSALATRIQAIN